MPVSSVEYPFLIPQRHQISESLGLIETLGSYPAEHFLLPGSVWTMGRGIACSSLLPHPIISSAFPFQLLGIGVGPREERVNVFVLNDSH